MKITISETKVEFFKYLESDYGQLGKLTSSCKHPSFSTSLIKHAYKHEFNLLRAILLGKTPASHIQFFGKDTLIY